MAHHLLSEKPGQSMIGFFTDDRIAFFSEPMEIETEFRKRSSVGRPSQKVWADALLVASVIGHRGQLITFDRAMQSHGADCVVLP